jgi:tetratricopeptide (TPR) repeat protein
VHIETAHRAAQETGLFVLPGAGGTTGWEQAYEKVFARALAFASEDERRVADERLRGWAQWAMLEPLAPPARLAIVDSDPAFHTFGLYDRLLEASRWAQGSEPAEAVDIVHLAIAVAERLDPARIGKRHVADLQAAAWAALGNAQRIAEDFERVPHSFNEAWRLLEDEGANDPLERASLLSLEASYIKDIGEFETAESALEEALEIYRDAGDVHQQGRTLLQMGEVIGHIAPQRQSLTSRKHWPFSIRQRSRGLSWLQSMRLRVAQRQRPARGGFGRARARAASV